MLGAIAGDIIGSVFEHRPARSPDVPLFTAHSVFTDDTVLTVATAHVLAVFRRGRFVTAIRWHREWRW
jgi:ADP-ribosylglycohydrolase